MNRRLFSRPGRSSAIGLLVASSALGLMALKSTPFPFSLAVTPHAAPFASGEAGGLTAYGQPGLMVLFMIDTDPSDSVLPVKGGVPINLGQSSDFTTIFGRMESDSLTVTCSVDCSMASLFGVSFWGQAVAYDPVTKEFQVSNREELRWEDLFNDCCAPCDGKVSELTLRYNGDSAENVHVISKAGTTLFDDIVYPGDEFTFWGDDKKGTMGPEIQLFVACDLVGKMHTSCSVPIGPGLVVGDFEVVSGESRNGGTLCPLGTTPNEDLCENGAQPASLTMTYTGDGCDASSHGQDEDSVSCWGDPEDEDEVHIVVKTKKGSVYFAGDVKLGESFEIDADEIGRSHLKSTTKVYVWNKQCTSLLQKVEFHTSCSQPLAVGDQYGSVRLDGFSLEE